jgi:hypothetical protein
MIAQPSSKAKDQQHSLGTGIQQAQGCRGTGGTLRGSMVLVS